MIQVTDKNISRMYCFSVKFKERPFIIYMGNQNILYTILIADKYMQILESILITFDLFYFFPYTILITTRINKSVNSFFECDKFKFYIEYI